MATSNIKSKVMKAAWKMYRKYKDATMKNWSKALKRAWKWAKENLMPKTFDISNAEMAGESEKAIKINVTVLNVVSDYEYPRNVWIPKSLINGNVIPLWFWLQKTDELISKFNQNPRNLVVNF